MAWTTPYTAVAGTLWTTGTHNTYLRDDDNFLFGEATWKTPGTPLATYWIANNPASFFSFGYRKIGNQVYCRGRMAISGPGTLPLRIWTFDAPYRPKTALVLICAGTAPIFTLTVDGIMMVTAGGGSDVSTCCNWDTL